MSIKIRNARVSLFLLIDLLRGGKVQKEYKYLEQYLKNSSYEKLKSFQSEKLSRILTHAQEYCEFYKAHQETNDIDSVPVINKTIVNNNIKKFLSSRFKSSSDLGKVVTTSGSTGSPFSVIHGKQKISSHSAEVIFFNELANFRFGDRLYYFRIWDKLVHKSQVKAFVQNLVLMDSSSLDCVTFQTKVLKKLEKEISGVSMLAYASTLEAFSNCLPKTKFKGKVNSIISMSETLPDGSREKLENYFRCHVVSRYSNMENGMIALQIPKNGYKYLVNEVGFYLEILKLNSSKKAEIGEVGRIVVTDLNNFAQPLVRYDTGDVGSVCYDYFDGVRRLFLNKIEGRRVDFITDVSGNLISPHVITNSMWKHKLVRQFQFIQLDTSEYKLILNVASKSNEVISPIIEDITHYIGSGARIAVEFTDEIPVLKSGKRKKVVNLMKV
jgi:phenylacetate-CoA ligase